MTRPQRPTDRTLVRLRVQHVARVLTVLVAPSRLTADPEIVPFRRT
ncbi:hypothetical protein [Natronorubrum halophilum]|nr:hypothetical protein [Natronorubrum halophilum]